MTDATYICDECVRKICDVSGVSCVCRIAPNENGLRRKHHAHDGVSPERLCERFERREAE